MKSNASNTHALQGAGAALTAAALFGLSAPLGKLLVRDAGPLAVSGVLYLGAGIGLSGMDSKPSERTRRVLIKNNLFYDVSGARWGGGGRLFQIYNGVTDLVIEHNTAFQDGPIIMTEGPPNKGFAFRGNLVPHNESGIQGTGSSPGSRTLDTYFPGAVVEKNVIVACPFSAQYPRANFFPMSLDKVGFEDRSGGNYRLTDRSSFRRAAISASVKPSKQAMFISLRWSGGSVSTALRTARASSFQRE